MADSATAKKMARPGASFARRYEEFRGEKEQLDELFELSPGAVILTDEDFHVLRVNREFTRIFGYTAEEAVGQWLPELIVPEELRAEAVKKQVSLISGNSVELEAIRQRKGGVRFDISVVAKRISLGFEQVAVYLIYRDITEHKKVERERRRREGYLAEAQKLTHTGSWAWDVRTGVLFWSRESFSIFHYEYQEMGLTWPQFLERIHPEDRPQIEQSARMETSGKEWLDSQIDFRIILPDGTIKHLHSVAHPVRDDSGEITEVVGTVMDVTEQWKARTELEKAFEEIRQRTEAARRSERELRDVVNTVPAHVWSTSPEGHVDFVNDRWLQFTGLALEEAFGWKWEAVVHPDDRTRVVADWHTALKNGRAMESEARVRRADGEYCWWFVRNVPLRDETGKLVRWYGTAIDIEDRKRAEEHVRASERKYRHLVDTTPAFIHTALPDGSLDFLSRGWLEYGGLPQTDFLDWRWTAAIHPEDVEGFVDKWRAALASGEAFVAESRVRRADGEYRWFLQRNVPLRDETGKIVKWYGTGIDIEERKTAEGKIREQEAELRQIVDLAPQFVGVFGPNREGLFVNRVALDYFGLTLEEWRQRFNSSGQPYNNKFLHPDDRERVTEDSDRSFSRGAAFELEMRLQKSDGSYRWFFLRYYPLHDEEGRITRWYVTGTDVEDRRQAEDRLRSENVALREEIDKASMFEEIVGTSPALKSVLSLISKVAPSDSTVLITGETGTGKELVARAIHKGSQRARQPFITVNCAAIPASLIASELFGHEKGAFTGAVQRRQGRFEMAHSGTIFLDEVGELPAETQIALLRVLQERQFERVGGNRIIPTDVRVIAATNRDLTAAIAAGTFRADLFYRFNVFPIVVPPLRKRKEDIPMLVEYFVKRYAEKAGKQIRKIDNNSLERCQSYAWPGNIRELQNIVERSVIFCSGDTFWIEKAWLIGAQPPPQELAGPLPDTLQNQEREIIETALTESKGKVAGPEGAAAKLGIPRSTLDSKIKQLRIKKHRFIAER